MEMLNKFAQYNVLVVDDDLDLCEIIKIYLSRCDFVRCIVFAHDGMSATGKMRNQKFDLILLDMKMPKKNGYDILEELKGSSFNSVSQVVAMSGTMDIDILTIATYHGVRTFLIKPFTEKLFREKVGSILLLDEMKNV